VDGIYNALKSGGKVLLQMGGYGNAKDIFKALDVTIKKYEDYFNNFESPYTFHTEEFYKKLLNQYRFKDYDVKLVKKDMIHKDIDAFKGWLRTTWFPYTDQLPENLREEFLDDLVQNYLKLVPLDSSNRVHIDMVRLEVMVEKE